MLKELLVKHPAYYRVYISLGQKAEKIEDKLACYDKVLERDPMSVEAFVMRGLAYLDTLEEN